jgi:DNA-binding MarR family transcriptional regulator
MDFHPIANNAPLERQLRQLIDCFDGLYQKLMFQRPAPVSSEVEMSRQESRVIIVLGSRGAMTMSDLARVLNLALSTATSTMDKLVGKELVERTRVDEDRRVVQVALSEKGRKHYGAFLECQLAIGRTMLEALSPGEREIFLELMAKMTQPRHSSVEAETEPAISAH